MLGGGGVARTSVGFMVVAGDRNGAQAMHPIFSYFHWIDPALARPGMCMVAGPRIPDLPPRISPPNRH